MKEIKIAPSILSSDLGKLAEEIDAVTAAGADILHIDVMDGHYVPNLTFGFPVIEAIRKYCKIPLDVHLMVTNPETYIEKLSAIGVEYISYHPATVHHNHRLLEQIKKTDIKAGWAINPSDSVYLLEPVMEYLDFVLFMSVNPGYSGQSFIGTVFKKIELFNKLLMTCEKPDNILIEVDGGVNDINAPLLAAAGTDILVAGSYIFGSGDYKQAIRSLHLGEFNAE